MTLSPQSPLLLAVVQANLAPLHHVHQSARCGHQQVAASLQVSDLLADVCAAIHHAGTHSGAVGKLQGATAAQGYGVCVSASVCVCVCARACAYFSGFIINLQSQLSGRSQHQ